MLIFLNCYLMSASKVIASVGLVSNIFGVILIGFLPREGYADGSTRVLPNYRKREKLGWILQVIGFTFQFIAVLLI